MTTSIAEQVRVKARGRPVERNVSLARMLIEKLRAQRHVEGQLTWPNPKYRHNIVGFFEDVLGIIPWSRQRELLINVQTYDRNACKSGRRTSKSLNIAGIGLWWYCVEKYARSIMSSTTARQVDAILWRELTMVRARAGRCINCVVDDPLGRGPKPCRHSALIDGEIGMLARTGLKSTDDFFREIFGCTARESEAMQGLAGSALFFELDESSGIPAAIFEAVEGNLAGGGHSLYTGNPTKTSGPFFDAFNKNAMDPKYPEQGGIRVMTISSYETPNVSAESREDLAQRFDRMAREADRESARAAAVTRAAGIRSRSVDVTGVTSVDAIRGLANAEWIRIREKEWGKDSPLFRVHVLGEFATNEDGRVFSIDTIDAAKARWSATPGPGRLHIGLDPAGASGTGDETCFVPRRGMIAEEAITKRGLNTDDHLAMLLGIIKERAVGREVAVVKLDRTGSIGSELYGRLVSYLEEARRQRLAPPFILIGVTASAKAQRQPMIYETVRDELTASLESAFKDGAAIPDDPRLEAELHVLEWHQQVNGRLKVTPKDEIKKQLGRSPDRFDALALAFYDETSLLAQETPPPAPTQSLDDAEERVTLAEDWLDPYANL